MRSLRRVVSYIYSLCHGQCLATQITKIFHPLTTVAPTWLRWRRLDNGGADLRRRSIWPTKSTDQSNNCHCFLRLFKPCVHNAHLTRPADNAAIWQTARRRYRGRAVYCCHLKTTGPSEGATVRFDQKVGDGARFWHRYMCDIRLHDHVSWLDILALNAHVLVV